jgi:hypothetical protein
LKGANRMQPISLSSRLSAGMGMVSRRLQRGQRCGAQGHMSLCVAADGCIPEIPLLSSVLPPQVRKQSFEYHISIFSTMWIRLDA